MAKNKTQVKIIEERKKRQAQLMQIEQGIQKRQQEIAALVEMRFKAIGAMEQLDELEKEK